MTYTAYAVTVSDTPRDVFRGADSGKPWSIIMYKQEAHDVLYVREDVAQRYTEHQLKETVDDSRMESMSAPIYDSIFSDDHGELTCLVKCFENVLELNFVLGDFEGVAVALDEQAFASTHGLVADAREIVLEERE